MSSSRISTTGKASPSATKTDAKTDTKTDTKSGTGMDRDVISGGEIQRLAQLRDGQNSQILSEAELLASRRSYIPDTGLDGDLLVFSYGSLIWNPCIEFQDRFAARLYGFHRRFCLRSTIGRGSPEAPGLVLGLDYGGSVQGVCFNIAKDKVASEADILWQREMLNGSYLPKWIKLSTQAGPRKALTFIIDRTKPAYMPRISEQETAHMISKASGFVGSCSEYLFSTQQALLAEGIHDPLMKKLVKLVSDQQPKEQGGS